MNGNNAQAQQNDIKMLLNCTMQDVFWEKH